MGVKLANNATSTLTSSIANDATSLSVQAGDAGKFPTLGAGDWFPLTLIDAMGNMEILRVTARAGNTLTVVRGQEGTLAIAFDAGTRADLRFTKGAVDSILAELDDLREDLGLKLNTSGLPAALAAPATKATPVDGDSFVLIDSASGDAQKRTLWSAIKETLKGYFDGLYSALGHAHDDRYFTETEVNATFYTKVQSDSLLAGKAASGHIHDDRYYTETEVNSLLAGNMSGRAYPRRSDGTAINVVWSDPGGAPTWYMGSSNGVDFRPYTPANMSVGYASSAGNASTVGGASLGTINANIAARAPNDTNLGVGTWINISNSFTTAGTTSSGAAWGLPGTWRAAYTGSSQMWQRIG